MLTLLIDGLCMLIALGAMLGVVAAIVVAVVLRQLSKETAATTLHDRRRMGQ